MTIGTIFSGGGGVEIGAQAAGITPIWAIENNVEIADIYRMNICQHVICADAQAVNPYYLDYADIIWTSPPCQIYSQAFALKERARANRHDGEIGLRLIRYLEILRHQCFGIENVTGYRHSVAYQQILQTLWRLGYFVHQSVLNSADFGVPSTRRRLILIAIRGCLVSMLSFVPQWCGWYEAIEDLVDELPDSNFADWQQIAVSLARKKSKGKFAVDGKALKSPTAEGYRLPTVRFESAPWCTITASQDKQSVRCDLRNVPVKKLTIRAMARLQSFPDSYALPDSKKVAMRIIGNAVPPVMAQRILEEI